MALAKLIEPQIMKELSKNTSTIHSVKLTNVSMTGKDILVNVQIQLKVVKGEKEMTENELKTSVMDSIKAEVYTGVKPDKNATITAESKWLISISLFIAIRKKRIQHLPTLRLPVILFCRIYFYTGKILFDNLFF